MLEFLYLADSHMWGGSRDGATKSRSELGAAVGNPNPRRRCAIPTDTQHLAAEHSMPRFLTYLSEHLLLSRHRTASRPGGRGTTAPAPRVFDLAELEDRILISAAPVPLEVTAGKVEAPESANSSGDGTAGRLTLVAAPISDTHSQTKTQPAAAPTAAEGARDTQLQRDLVVLDANAANIQQMLADLLSQEDPTQPLDVALLDAPHEIVDFDSVSGQLTVHGDARDNAVHQSFTADGFLTITLDGVTRSAQPLSPFYDPALAGASSTTLRSIVMSGSGGQDSLTLGDQSLDGGLTVQTDGDLVVAGSIRVAERFLAEAATIELVGSIVAPSGHVTLHSTWATLVTGLLDVSALPDGMGGRVELLGPCVAVLDSATIDASGDFGGGIVLVGGDYQGHNPDIENAQHTWVGTGSQIRPTRNAKALVAKSSCGRTRPRSSTVRSRPVAVRPAAMAVGGGLGKRMFAIPRDGGRVCRARYVRDSATRPDGHHHRQRNG